LAVEQAYRQATGTAGAPDPAPVNASVWGTEPPKAPHERRPLKVDRMLDARTLVEDATIRRLFAAVMLEPAPLPGA
jgi:hypothetical protein